MSPHKFARWNRTLLLFVALGVGCSDGLSSGPDLFPPATERLMAGGATTVYDESALAFSYPAANLSGSSLALHRSGELAFKQTFVAAPSVLTPGLGPVFNNSSCLACHSQNGRTRDGFLFRMSLPGTDVVGGPLAVPGYGGQLQDRAILGHPPEGLRDITYVELQGQFDDGTPYSLRRPTIRIAEPYTPLPGGVLLSNRMPPPVIGLGLLEAVSEITLQGLADEFDADGDGISGRPNRVWDPLEERLRIGRFGWKAGQPTLLLQSAAAFVNDMGITSPVFPEETSAGQFPHDDGRDDDPEISQAMVDATAFFVRTVGVPAPRNVTAPQVLDGEEIFEDIGCTGCHVPRLVTGGHPEGISELSNQVIFPFTDLLLHDMGEGLSDNRPVFAAQGSEWRTAPLWGLGLTLRVNGHTDLLHDGRARTITEAILWHGGEALASQQAFKALSASQREALLAFLRSL